MTSAGKILIMPKGEYDESTTYERLDLVTYNGTSWLAKKTVVGIKPSDANSEYWQDMFETPVYESGTNYVKLPDGTLICYGNVQIDANGGQKTIYFPKTFKDTNIYLSFANHFFADGKFVWSVGDLTTTSVNVVSRNSIDGKIPSVATKASYIAIGRWK